MNEGSHSIKSKYARRRVCRFGKVAHDGHVRTLVALWSEFLAAETRHPSTLAFACSWEKVSIEYCQVFVVFVFYLVGHYFGVVGVYVCPFMKGNAKEFLSSSEYSISYFF